MEVHHHPDLHHKQKHFKEYFLEFLMIFLAVTLGFFAENYREHLSDRSKEKEYMKSMVEDLKSDTASLGNNIKFWTDQAKTSDSLSAFIKEGKAELNIDELYRLVFTNYTFINFLYNSTTVDELRNSGNFELIRKRNVAAAIVSYDNGIRFVEKDQELDVKTAWHTHLDMQGEIIDYNALPPFYSIFKENSQFIKELSKPMFRKPLTIPTIVI